MSMNYHGVYVPDCPNSYGNSNCTDVDYRKPLFGALPVAVSLFSCCFSVIGSIITILPYILWKDVRRSAIRRVITYLAIADMFTASGYIMASINYLTYQSHKDNNDNACIIFDNVCQIQAYISSWASYSSFWWTSLLALFFYWTVVKGEMKRGDRYFPVYHILSWGSPIIVMLPLLATGSLGYSLFAAGGWCFIRGQNHISSSGVFTGYSLNYLTIIKTLVGGKAFEIFTYIWVIVLYVTIQCDMRKKRKDDANYITLSLKAKEALRQIEQKTLAIPVAFILIRIWGTMHFIFSIIVYSTGSIDSTGCTSTGVYVMFMILIVMQSLGDGAQGWCNAILYIVISPKIRQRFVNALCKRKSKNEATIVDEDKKEVAEKISVVFSKGDETVTPMISSVTLSMDTDAINKVYAS